MTRRKMDAGAEARLRAVLAIDLDAETEPPAPAWKPEPGDELIGVLIGFTTAPSQFGKPVQIALVEDLEGIRHSVWCSPKMLKSRIRETSPQPGDGIAIKRLEDRDSGKDHPLKQFKVAVDRNSGPPHLSDGELEGGTQ